MYDTTRSAACYASFTFFLSDFTFICVVLIRPPEVKGFCFCGAGEGLKKETCAISCMHGTYDIEDIGSMDLGVPRLDIYKAGSGH